MQLSSLLLIFVAIFLLVERLERNKLAYSYAGSTFKPINLALALEEMGIYRYNKSKS